VQKEVGLTLEADAIIVLVAVGASSAAPLTPLGVHVDLETSRTLIDAGWAIEESSSFLLGALSASG